MSKNISSRSKPNNKPVKSIGPKPIQKKEETKSDKPVKSIGPRPIQKEETKSNTTKPNSSKHWTSRSVARMASPVRLQVTALYIASRGANRGRGTSSMADVQSGPIRGQYVSVRRGAGQILGHWLWCPSRKRLRNSMASHLSGLVYWPHEIRSRIRPATGKMDIQCITRVLHNGWCHSPSALDRDSRPLPDFLFGAWWLIPSPPFFFFLLASFSVLPHYPLQFTCKTPYRARFESN